MNYLFLSLGVLMKIISDLHLHSKYSRATSKQLDIDNLEIWAKVKGLNLLGTGDFTHPEWIKELKSKLKDMDYPTPLQMLKNVKGTGLAHFYACSPTMAMFNIKKEDLIPEVDKILGAAAFLDLASKLK